MVRPGGLAERRPRRDVDPLERGPDLRRRRPEAHDGLERHGGPRRASTRASSRPASSGATDGGATWAHVEGLTNHPTRPEWQPGTGGLILHSIVPHPTDPARIWVGISAVGVFETRDGGATWETRNKGVRAEFNPENRYPEFGQCVHKLVMAADGGERLYQQNHCGVYRSTDGGAAWEEITAGLPSDFGFPMAAHPRDPRRSGRSRSPTRGGPPDARRRARRSGAPTTAATRGSAPARACRSTTRYLGVLREAMAVDRLDPVGVYFGTSTGPGLRLRRRGPSPGRWSRTTCRRSGPWRRTSSTDGRRARRRPPAALARRPLPGRRAAGRGPRCARSLEVITDLDRRVPGLANRLLDAGPVIRTHLNVFVDGERATLETPVPAGADVHVIPAVSGADA